MKVLYVAEDGRTFDNEEDCRKYETQTFIEDSYKFIHLKTINGIEASLYDVESFQSAFCDPKFCFLTIDQGISKDNIERLNMYIREFGLFAPTKPGKYRWDEYEENWISYEKDYAEFCKKWQCGE